MFSLEISPLAGLIDMYYTRAATNGLDRVYALLGMGFPIKLALVWDWGNSDEQKRPQEGTTISDNRPPSTDP